MTFDEVLLSHRNYYGTYHHHKEQMAYGATVLYLAAATAVILKGTEIWQSPASQCVVILLLIAAFIFAFLFVWWQLRNRELAADIVMACTTLITHRLATSTGQPDTRPDTYRNLVFPAGLVTELRNISTSRGLLDGPRVAEVLTYLAIIGWSVLAAIRAWP